MTYQTVPIPTIPELIACATALNYTVTQPDQTHTHVHLALDSHHPVVPLLAQYALLVSAGLEIWEASVSLETTERPDFSLFTSESLLATVTDLQGKPCEHYRGWIGEIIIYFILHHFITQHRALLGYTWEAIQPPKTDVTGGELDIVAAYEWHNQQLGHISGEVKTYEGLSQAKSKAYSDLEKARKWSDNRDAEIRRTLNALLRPRFNIDAVRAATLAMADERSFLPGLVHSTATQFKKRSTFGDLPQKFDICTRPSQLIGMQVVISDYGGSCDANPLQTGFFENFIQQMRQQAIAWKNTTGVPDHV